MPSRTIRPTEAPAAAPFVYTLGATESFVPLSISAEVAVPFAANDSYAVVSYYSPEGVLIGRERTSENIPFGETAEVSFYPFRRGGGGTALIVTDGGSTISPTTELFIDGGLALGIGGTPGEAVLSALPQPAVQAPYAYGTFAAGNASTTELGVTVAASSGFTADAHGLSAQTAGVYLLAVNGTLTLAGGALADTSFSLFAEVNHGLTYGSLWERPEAVVAGHNLIVDGGSSNPVPLAVADRVTFRVSTSGVAAQTFTGGGRFLLLQVA